MKKIILFALLSCSINNYCISQEMENIPLTIDSMFKIAEENNRAIKLQKLLEENYTSIYTFEKEEVIADIENALYYLKAIAQNEYNADYFRTFWNLLQII